MGLFGEKHVNKNSYDQTVGNVGNDNVIINGVNNVLNIHGITEEKLDAALAERFKGLSDELAEKATQVFYSRFAGELMPLVKDMERAKASSEEISSAVKDLTDGVGVFCNRINREILSFGDDVSKVSQKLDVLIASENEKLTSVLMSTGATELLARDNKKNSKK